MNSLRSSWLRDLSLSAIVAGFVAVLVGFTSSVAIVFHAAQSLGASTAQIGSWVWALCMGMGITCIALSLRYRIPVVTAWSTPGAAMLVGTTSGLPMSQVIGAFVVTAVLTAIAGFSGAFERIIDRIPVTLASAMLAGVLLRFGLDAFTSIQTQPALVLTMLAAYLLARRWSPRYAVVLTLLAGLAVAGSNGLLQFDSVQVQLARPEFIAPTFSVTALIGIALPLFIVTMASQNVPGVAITRASGYTLPISHSIGWIGAVNTVLAPFGAYSLSLAAITAAICMGPEAHHDRQRRYLAAVAAGVFYLLVGLFGATVAAVFSAFPKELVMAIAGIALFATISHALTTAMRDEAQREAATITFLVTASGLHLCGIGSAFWGLLAGIVVLLIWRPRA